MKSTVLQLGSSSFLGWRRFGALAIVGALALVAATLAVAPAGAADRAMVPGNALSAVEDGIDRKGPAGKPEFIRKIFGPRAHVVVWSGIDDESVLGYELQFRRLGNKEWSIGNHVGPKVRAFGYYTGFPGGFDHNHGHDFRIRAYSQDGLGKWSDVYRAVPSWATVPEGADSGKLSSPAVRRLRADVSGQDVTLSWRHSVAGGGDRCASVSPRQYRYRVLVAPLPAKGWDSLLAIDWVRTAEKSAVYTAPDVGQLRMVGEVQSYSQECGGWSRSQEVVFTVPAS